MFAVALKMINVIDKKQIHDSVTTVKEKVGIVLYRCFWWIL